MLDDVKLVDAKTMRRTVHSRAVIFCGILSVAALLVLSAQEGGPAAAGGDIIPLRQVSDPYPVFNGIAIDTENNEVAMTDVNRKSLVSYPRLATSRGGEI